MKDWFSLLRAGKRAAMLKECIKHLQEFQQTDTRPAPAKAMTYTLNDGELTIRVDSATIEEFCNEMLEQVEQLQERIAKGQMT